MAETVIDSLKVEVTIPAKAEEVKVEYPKHFFIYTDSGKVVAPNSHGDVTGTVTQTNLKTILSLIDWGAGKVSVIEKTVQETEIIPK